MNCTDFQEQIALYVGGDLLEKEQVLVEKHLASCERCAKFMVDLEESQLALVKFGQIDLPETIFTNLRISVMAEIRVKAEKTNWWKQIFNFRFNFWRYAFVTVAGLMVVALYSYSFWLSKSSREVLEMSKNNVKETFSVLSENKIEKTNATNQTNNTSKTLDKGLGTNSIKPLRASRTSNINRASKINKKVNSINNFEIAENISSESNKLFLESLETTTAETKVKMEIQTNNPNIRIIWLVNEEEKVLEKRTNS